MDFKQLELDFQIKEDGFEEVNRKESFANVVSLHSARQERRRQKLASLYKEIIESVEHIETTGLQYK